MKLSGMCLEYELQEKPVWPRGVAATSATW